MTSPDGINWTLRTTADAREWCSITYGNGLFVVISKDCEVITSSDGINWTNPSTPSNQTDWNSITYGNGLFVAVGNSLTGTYNKLVMTSSDGITWTMRVAASINNWSSVTYGNGLYVAVAKSGNANRVMTSPNGINWTSQVSTLPVTWQSFTVEKQGDASILIWSTASEQNAKDFEVQHSTNALSWTPLGTLAAIGNSTTTRQYSFTHATPFKGNIYNYYRILQRDLDGNYSYSKVVSLTFLEKGAGMHVYPNPAGETITVFLTESQEARLINAAGAIIWSGTLNAGRNQITLTQVTKGMYWIVSGNTKKQLLIQY
jgi:hypothetical protein